MMRPRRNQHSGFTLLESMIVLAVLGITVIAIVPNMLTMISRTRLTTTAQQLSSLFYQARLESIKRGDQGVGAAGINGRVEVNFTTRTAMSYIDLDGSLTFNTGDVKLGELVLGRDLEFHGPGPMSTANAGAIWNFDTSATGGSAIFKSDGSVVKAGAFRVRDTRGNILEVRVEPQATARVAVQKFTGANPDGADDLTKWIRQDQGWSWN